jgi:hypothetical protein
VNKSFNEYDIYQFDKELFRDTNDRNLNLLLELHYRLEDTMNTWVNINNIIQEELDDFEE